MCFYTTGHKYWVVIAPLKHSHRECARGSCRIRVWWSTLLLIIYNLPNNIMSALINRCYTPLSSLLVQAAAVCLFHMMSETRPQDLESWLPCRCYPPPPTRTHTAGCGSGWSNLLLPVCRCSDSQRALPWKLGHTDYMFWPAPMSVMQTENWEKSRGERKGRRSGLFISLRHDLCLHRQEFRDGEQACLAFYMVLLTWAVMLKVNYVGESGVRSIVICSILETEWVSM